jgi:hypothetical protein
MLWDGVVRIVNIVQLPSRYVGGMFWSYGIRRVGVVYELFRRQSSISSLAVLMFYMFNVLYYDYTRSSHYYKILDL